MLDDGADFGLCETVSKYSCFLSALLKQVWVFVHNFAYLPLKCSPNLFFVLDDEFCAVKFIFELLNLLC